MECGRQEAEELGRRGAKIVRMFAGSKVQMFNASKGAGEFDRFMQELALCHFLESPSTPSVILRSPPQADRRRISPNPASGTGHARSRRSFARCASMRRPENVKATVVGSPPVVGSDRLLRQPPPGRIARLPSALVVSHLGSVHAGSIQFGCCNLAIVVPSGCVKRPDGPAQRPAVTRTGRWTRVAGRRIGFTVRSQEHFPRWRRLFLSGSEARADSSFGVVERVVGRLALPQTVQEDGQLACNGDHGSFLVFL